MFIQDDTEARKETRAGAVIRQTTAVQEGRVRRSGNK